MNHQEKSREQLIEELESCQRRLRELEARESERGQIEHALEERVKELRCLYAVQRDIQKASSVDVLCQQVVEHLIPAMQHPGITVPAVELNGGRWSAEGYSEELSEEPSHELRADIRVNGEARGQLRIAYTKGRPFLPEEQDLVDVIAESLGLWLEQKETEDTLRESETRYMAIAEHLPNGMVHVLDRDLRYTFSAGETLEEIGLSDEELLGRTVHDVLPPRSAEKAASHYRRALNGESVSFECSFADRIFLVNAEPLTDGNEEVDKILVLSIDITKRKRAEELASRTPILRGINRIFQETLQGKTEEELAKTCLSIAEELTESQFGFICEVNERGRLDTIAISDPGWAECLIEDSEQVIKAQDLPVRGIRGQVIKQGKALIFNDPAAHPDWIEPPERHPTVASFVGVPLEDARKRTIGMIGLANKEGGYDDDAREVVEALSVAVVQALERKQLQETLARQAEEILEISTPTMQIWDGIVAAPLIGTLDSERTQRFMEELLNAIVETGSEIALVDITGVPTIDTMTAQHLIEAISAVRLLGAEVVLTGVRPSIAQTLVHLGIDLSNVTTRSSLAAGIKVAFDRFELQIVEQS